MALPLVSDKLFTVLVTVPENDGTTVENPVIQNDDEGGPTDRYDKATFVVVGSVRLLAAEDCIGCDDAKKLANDVEFIGKIRLPF